ncbi:MAG: SDR family NAD(P)-dependent oxidoreductase [Gammaproteobacteria bacterium]
MGRLEGKTAIVTGAGQGIGLGIAEAFAAEGANVVLFGRTLAKVQDAAGAISARTGARTLALGGDVARREDANAAVAACVGTFGAVDVMVNNAQTVSNGTPLADMTDAQWRSTIESGLYGSFYFMQAVLPHMQARGGGSVINFGSRQGVEGRPGSSAYAATKEGIRGLSRVAAREWGKFKIRVNVLNPAAMSPAAEKFLASNPEYAQKVYSEIAMGYLGDSLRDIAPVAVFLASDDSRYVSGQTINVDGGLVML